MANGVPSIEIAEPGGLFKDLGAAILKGVISDAFYQARRDRIDSSTTLWDAYKLDAEAALKLTNPYQVEDSINRIDLALSNPETPQNLIPSLEGARGSLSIHLDRLEDEAGSFEMSDVREGYEKTFSEAVVRNGLNYGFLDEIIEEYESEEARLLDEYLPERMGDVEEARKAIDNMIISERAEFANKYYKEGTTELRDDLTADQLQSLVKEQEVLQTKSISLRENLDKALEMSNINPVRYLKDVKGDRLAGVQLDLIQKDIRLFKAEADKAQSLKKLNTSITDFKEILKDSKKNPDHFGELSSKLLKELGDVARVHSDYITKTHLDIIDEMHKDALSTSSALSVINNAKLIKQKGGYESDAANDLVDLALSEATRGYLSEDTRAVSTAVTKLSSAIEKERLYHKEQGQRIRQEKKELKDSTSALLSTRAAVIDEAMGKGAKGDEAKEDLDSSYLEGGKWSINMNPSALLKGFNIDSPENIKAYKEAIGENIAKFVKSSKLSDTNSDVNKLVGIILNPSYGNKKKVEALDELFKDYLYGKTTDLNFEGTFSKDSSAERIYSEYLKMYEILDNAEKTSFSKWGEDFKVKYVQDHGYGDTNGGISDSLTGENLNFW